MQEDLETGVGSNIWLAQEVIQKAFIRYPIKDWEVSVNKEIVKCWEEFKRDEDRMQGCVAKSITTWSWFKVLTNEEGLKCLVKAKDDPKGLLACKSKATEEQTNNVTPSEVLKKFF